MPFYRLAELTAATGATPRTVRYYIVEGLLPPPQGVGPAAVYTDAHRDRLLLIARLKGEYLPLREIRRRLAAMNDNAVRAALQEPVATTPPPAPDPAPTPAVAPVAASPPAPATPDPPPGGERWERITLADGIELHVRDDRRTERILLDALIRRARDLLGGC